MTSEATSPVPSAVPVAEFDLALPRKRMASTVLLFDESDRVLVVEPTYVDFMELPGGSVDLDESPRQAAIREVKEELGLDRDPGRLLAVDWVPPRQRGGAPALRQLGTAVAQQADPEPPPPEFRQDAERVVPRLAEAGMTAPVMRERDGELGG
jgi:8-oxo-dGTP pyrophosphatase MutT (NUDIX family)